MQLSRLSLAEISVDDRSALTREAKDAAAAIVLDVKQNKYQAVVRLATKFGDISSPQDKIIYSREELKAAFDGLGIKEQELLRRTAERIKVFAQAQKDSLKEMEISIPGGRAGHTIAAVESAGCYAPGGRYPLPSSVLMTAITARVAGVKTVWVASPKPVGVTLASAYVSDADALVAIGGAHAIAALAYGAGEIPSCDCIVGPGNQYVTAAKAIVSEKVKIDQLAGPSECLVLADDSADPRVVAADLLAQAEHDVQALPILVSMSENLVGKVEEEISRQLETLPTSAVAKEAMKLAFAVVCSDIETAIAVCDKLAPEHLEVHLTNSREVAKRLNHYGGLFIGPLSAEVIGDYGAGPNHTLPTGGSARSFGGLSVFSFLRIRTFIDIDNAAESQQLVEDSIALGEMEGLIGHARSAATRRL